MPLSLIFAQNRYQFVRQLVISKKCLQNVQRLNGGKYPRTSATQYWNVSLIISDEWYRAAKYTKIMLNQCVHFVSDIWCLPVKIFNEMSSFILTAGGIKSTYTWYYESLLCATAMIVIYLIELANGSKMWKRTLNCLYPNVYCLNFLVNQNFVQIVIGIAFWWKMLNLRIFEIRNKQSELIYVEKTRFIKTMIKRANNLGLASIENIVTFSKSTNRSSNGVSIDMEHFVLSLIIL